jgi:hypothetical protein
VELSGRTDFLSLFDVAQVLSVNEASGMLKVEQDDGKGYLYFHDGAIINALDPEHGEGEEAAKRVFGMKRARFSFVADLPSVAHRIECSTQNLMMEIARALDEEGAKGGQAEGDNVREAREATSALRELFRRLDSESKVLAHRSPQGFAVADLLGAVRGAPESVLFLRPDAVPEVHAGGRVIPLGATALDRPGYESLRDHLLREAGGGRDVLDVAGGERLLRLSDAESYRLETLRGGATEILAIRPQSDDPTLDPPWGDPDVAALFADAGSLGIVRATEPRGLERAIHALARGLLAQGAVPLVGCARRWPAGLGDGRASVVLLHAGHAEEREAAPEIADRLAPRFVVVEDADAPGAAALALRAVRRGSRAMVGACAPRADAAVARLVDALPAEDRAAAARTIADSLRAVLEPPDAEGRRLVVTADASLLARIA